MSKFKKKLPKRKLENKKPLKKTKIKPRKITGLRYSDEERKQMVKDAKERDKAWSY